LGYDVDGRTRRRIINWILKKQFSKIVDWIQLVQHRVQ
jgi:hypothetical protein